MKPIIKTILFILLFSQSLFSQNFQITNVTGPTANQQACDSLIVLSVAPLQMDFNSPADYLYAIEGTSFSAGPIQISVNWGDGTNTIHNGQMTTAGVMINFVPALEHEYQTLQVYTVVMNVLNPNNSSQFSHTSQLQVQNQNCIINLYSSTSINCSGVDPNIANNVPYVFTDTQGNEYTEWMFNGSASSSQLPAGIYTVTIAQWWLDMYGLSINSIFPQTIQLSPGGAYTFQAILDCSQSTSNNCLSGTVFCDENQNGILDGNEIGIENAQVVVTSGSQSYTVTSGVNGAYSINYVNIPNGASIVQIDPNWMSQNGFGTGSMPYTFLDVECGSGGQTYNLPVLCDSSQLNNECVGGWLFCDENNNGVLDQNETGFANAPVHITGTTNSVTVYTNANGNFFYSGSQLGGGVAIVEVEQSWLTQNGYFSNSNLFYTIQTDCSISQPVYFPIICDSLQTPCADLWTMVDPWIGYYQNQVNYVKLKWGNNGPSAAQNYTLTLNYPAGVTPVTSSIQNSNYVISGNSISWDFSSSSTYFNFSDIIYFNVPGGLSSGTAHDYSATITANGYNQDCHLNNNQDTLTMILGNSYDPNDKTVNKSEIISPDEDDELTYRIRFQNTGTAPAQDIYILDTLDTNLDWSTFELLDATHYIQVIDLGNGIMKFNFPNIWLVDSTVSYEESQGSLTYRIKENIGNSIGSTIENTAYIYFDWNPAIVTNTTYNINTVLSVEELENVDLTIYPNPFTDEINFDSSNEITEVRLLDINGKLILSESDHTIHSISTINLSPGVYLLETNVNGRWITNRVIKN